MTIERIASIVFLEPEMRATPWVWLSFATSLALCGAEQRNYATNITSHCMQIFANDRHFHNRLITL